MNTIDCKSIKCQIDEKFDICIVQFKKLGIQNKLQE